MNKCWMCKREVAYHAMYFYESGVRDMMRAILSYFDGSMTIDMLLLSPLF